MLQPGVGLRDGQRPVVADPVARRVVEVEKGVSGGAGLHGHRLAPVFGPRRGDQVGVVGRREEGQRVVFGTASAHQEAGRVPGDGERLLPVRGQQFRDQHLQLDRGPHDFACVGVVAVGHVRLRGGEPAPDRREFVDVQGGHARRLGVRPHVAVVGRPEGEVPQEFPLPGLSQDPSRGVQPLRRDPHPACRNVVPHRGEALLRGVRLETPRTSRRNARPEDPPGFGVFGRGVLAVTGRLDHRGSEVRDGETVFHGAFHRFEPEGRGVDELRREGVPEGISPFVSGPDRVEVLPHGGPVQPFGLGAAAGAGQQARHGGDQEEGPVSHRRHFLPSSVIRNS